MQWLHNLERRFGRYSIPNLVTVLLCGQLVTGAVILLLWGNLLFFLPLERTAVLHGQIWRLVSFVFMPTWIGSPLGILNLLFYWWAGNALTQYWGDFKMQVFLGLGILGAWAGCALTGYGSAEGIFLSLFFAFAWMWPDQQVLLLGIIPLKVKWLGWFEALLWLRSFLLGGFSTRISLVLGLLGFVVFFGREMWEWARDGVVSAKRRRDWKNKFK